MTSQSTMIRVLIADDHLIVRQGLATIINRNSEMTVVAQAENGQQAIDCFRKYQPDVTLMDLRMPELGGGKLSAPFVLNLSLLESSC